MDAPPFPPFPPALTRAMATPADVLVETALARPIIPRGPNAGGIISRMSRKTTEHRRQARMTTRNRKPGAPILRAPEMAPPLVKPAAHPVAYAHFAHARRSRDAVTS